VSDYPLVRSLGSKFLWRGCSCFRTLGLQPRWKTRTSAVYLGFSQFLARTVSEISGEPWSIPANDHKAHSTTRFSTRCESLWP